MLQVVTVSLLQRVKRYVLCGKGGHVLCFPFRYLFIPLFHLLLRLYLKNTRLCLVYTSQDIHFYTQENFFTTESYLSFQIKFKNQIAISSNFNQTNFDFPRVYFHNPFSMFDLEERLEVDCKKQNQLKALESFALSIDAGL
ncbi:hypothetical protein Droror1_Dr00003451 [Drosera rotundifolia]